MPSLAVRLTAQGRFACRHSLPRYSRSCSQHTEATRSHKAVMRAAWQESATAPDQRVKPPRSGHCSAPLPQDHQADIVIYGGYTEDDAKQREASGDTWTYSSSEGSWKQLQYAPGPHPRVRIAAQAVVACNKLWLLAGWDPGHKQDGGDILSDIQAMDLATNKWEEIVLNGPALPAISRFQAAVVGDSIFVHTHRSTSTILVLDVAQQAPLLTEVPYASTEAPPSRGLHSMTAVGKKLWIFGGAPKSGPMMDDLWELDIQALSWRQIPKKGSWPAPRCSHAAAAVGDKVYIQGGSFYREDGQGLDSLNDLWSFDTASEQWENHGKSAEQGPSPRNAAVMEAVGGKLVHHGGWLPFKQTYSDTWTLDVAAL